MKIAIAGGSGFLGKRLSSRLRASGHDVLILTRRKKTPFDVEWLQPNAEPERMLEGADAFINLAGASLNGGRWTAKRKREIYESRMEATDELLRIARQLEAGPVTWVNASAVGIYPTSETALYTESARAIDNGFLGRTVQDWEERAAGARELGMRTSFARFGVLLGTEGGALPLMALPYKLFAGGPVGSGKQWMSWVHVDDAARAVEFALHCEDLSGPFNVTAPEPVTMNEFSRALADALKRPGLFRVPELPVKALLGEQSQVVLEGQRALPDRLLSAGFAFRWPHLDTALSDLYD